MKIPSQKVLIEGKNGKGGCISAILGLFSALLWAGISAVIGGALTNSKELAIGAGVVGLVFGCTIGKAILKFFLGGIVSPSGFFGILKSVFLFLVVLAILMIGTFVFLKNFS